MKIVILSFLGIAVATVAVERTMRVFFEKRRTPAAVTALSYLLLWATLALSPQPWLPVSPQIAMLAYFVALVVVSLNYESVVMKRVAAVAGGHYVMLAFTGINNALAHFLPANWLIGDVSMALIISSLFVFLTVIIAFPFFTYIKKTTINLNKLWIPFAILPIAHSFAEIFFNINPIAVTVFLTMLNSLGVILIFLSQYNVLSKVFENMIESALHSQEREYYFTQCQLMQESVDKMKAYRHDVKLHLAALKDFTVNNKTEEATTYLNSLLGSINESDIYSDTGNIAFDSIINFKLKDVLQDNINLQVKIFVPPQLNIEVADVVTILGNLLDNAFDAVHKVKDKTIKLTVETSKGNLFIKVDNTFDGIIKYEDDGNGKKNIATRKSGDIHGYGLKNVFKSVEKYNGHVDITHEDNVFSVAILMYVGD